MPSRFLAPGVPKRNRSTNYHRKGLWTRKGKPGVQKPAAASTTKTVVKDFGKKKPGKRTVITPKAPRFYPAEDTQQPTYSRSKHNPPKIRKSLKPGAVVILLAGKFRGRRAVLLKTLPSGLAVVTGPYKINGVPIKRVDPAYLIVTSTCVDIGGDLGLKLNDDYFKRPKDSQAAKPANVLEGEAAKKKEIAQSRKDDQVKVDKLVLAAVKKQKFLKPYLASRFTLSYGQFPHSLKF